MDLFSFFFFFLLEYILQPISLTPTFLNRQLWTKFYHFSFKFWKCFNLRNCKNLVTAITIPMTELQKSSHRCEEICETMSYSNPTREKLFRKRGKRKHIIHYGKWVFLINEQFGVPTFTHSHQFCWKIMYLISNMKLFNTYFLGIFKANVEL